MNNTTDRLELKAQSQEFQTGSLPSPQMIPRLQEISHEKVVIYAARYASNWSKPIWSVLTRSATIIKVINLHEMLKISNSLSPLWMSYEVKFPLTWPSTRNATWKSVDFINFFSYLSQVLWFIKSLVIWMLFIEMWPTIN